MTIEVDAAEPLVHRHVPGILVAGLASAGAGAVHLAAVGVHADHPALARTLVLFGFAQLCAGLWALLRAGRPAAAAVALVDGVAVAGWLVTRLTGVSWIDGLSTREAAHFADASCAALGVVAAGAAMASLLVGWQTSSHPPRLMRASIAVAVLATPAMIVAGTDVHAHAAGASTDHAAGHADAAADDHDHAAAPSDAAAPGSTATDTGGPGTEHTHPADPTATGAPAVTSWPRPWEPTQPVDLSGVPGVTAEQEARAKALVERSLVDLPHWTDPATAAAEGYRSIGDAGTGSEHYIKYSLIEDGVILDPTEPESLVYAVDGDRRTLAGAMFIAPAQPTDSPALVEWAGPLMEWHNHGNLCWDASSGAPRVVGVVGPDGACARGVNAGGGNPMVHVWITPHPCGVFAALEGIGAGQAAVADLERTDLCHEEHPHPTGDTGAAAAAGAATVPYDPAAPIDLSGVPGVTPAQQAAAENLVAVTVVRLPRWADPATAEAAGFHSIGDAATGHEHFVNWSWIDDDVILDPDRPESLVYEPQPDGTKRLVSAMYMLASAVTLTDVPDIGGALMQWHIHDDLCFTTDAVAPQVRGLAGPDGTCGAGLRSFPPSPMIHVWITPHPCGPFAALEGVGAGQIADGQERLCNHAHGAGLL